MMCAKIKERKVTNSTLISKQIFAEKRNDKEFNPPSHLKIKKAFSQNSSDNSSPHSSKSSLKKRTFENSVKKTTRFAITLTPQTPRIKVRRQSRQ